MSADALAFPPVSLPMAVESCARTLGDLNRAQPVVAIALDAEGAASICARGNASQLLRMAEAICRLAAKQPRVTDCDICADAHDRLTQALALLSQASGRC